MCAAPACAIGVRVDAATLTSVQPQVSCPHALGVCVGMDMSVVSIVYSLALASHCAAARAVAVCIFIHLLGGASLTAVSRAFIAVERTHMWS